MRELLLNLHVIEKGDCYSYNSNNKILIVKVNNSKDTVKSSRHVKRHLKSVRKLRNSIVIMVTYIQIDKNLADPFTIELS